jgi:hypothetical protein
LQWFGASANSTEVAKLMERLKSNRDDYRAQQQDKPFSLPSSPLSAASTKKTLQIDILEEIQLMVCKGRSFDLFIDLNQTARLEREDQDEKELKRLEIETSAEIESDRTASNERVS